MKRIALLNKLVDQIKSKGYNQSELSRVVYAYNVNQLPENYITLEEVKELLGVERKLKLIK